MGWIIGNAILLTLVVGWLLMGARSRYLERRDPRPRADYVPPFWRSGPWTDGLSRSPRRMFWYLVLLPVAGLIAGVVLLVTNDRFGGVLILASLIGAWRVRASAQRALRAVRARDDQWPGNSA